MIRNQQPAFLVAMKKNIIKERKLCFLTKLKETVSTETIQQSSFPLLSHQPNEQRENTREKPCGNDIRSRDRDTPLNRLDRRKGSCPEGESVVETFINRLDLRKGVPL